MRPQRSAAEVRRELESREEARNNVKLIWRALAAMASGQDSHLMMTCNPVCVSAKAKFAMLK